MIWAFTPKKKKMIWACSKMIMIVNADPQNKFSCADPTTAAAPNTHL